MQQQKIKIFKLLNGIDGLETLVNDWMQQNPSYQIENISISVGPRYLESTERDVIILYRTNE